MLLAEPSDIRAAATRPDPYPYYARLAVERPIYRETPNGAWVVTSAAMVRAVLASPACASRPPDEVVPSAMAGSPTGDIYARLARINNGRAHCPLKNHIAAAIDMLDLNDVEGDARRRAT